MLVALMEPKSIGRLRLRSASPRVPPVIEPRLLSHPDDLARLTDGVDLARGLAQAAPMRRFATAELGHDGGDTRARVVQLVSSYNHAVGTCRMGPATDRHAVVNRRGDVHGAQRLSVVDASIMPTIPAANTCLPTLMLAERCADLLAEGSSR
jgi:choline dehydrogenase